MAYAKGYGRMSDLTQRRLMMTAKVSEITGLSERTLVRHRVEGGGIPYIRLGAKRVAYREEDVRAWLAGRTFGSHAAEFSHAA